MAPLTGPFEAQARSFQKSRNFVPKPRSGNQGTISLQKLGAKWPHEMQPCQGLGGRRDCGVGGVLWVPLCPQSNTATSSIRVR